jgi:hypothetical protein
MKAGPAGALGAAASAQPAAGADGAVPSSELGWFELGWSWRASFDGSTSPLWLPTVTPSSAASVSAPSGGQAPTQPLLRGSVSSGTSGIEQMTPVDSLKPAP